jgi:hypothetical protein
MYRFGKACSCSARSKSTPGRYCNDVVTDGTEEFPGFLFWRDAIVPARHLSVAIVCISMNQFVTEYIAGHRSEMDLRIAD